MTTTCEGAGRLTRRDVLRGSGLAIGGLAVGGGLLLPDRVPAAATEAVQRRTARASGTRLVLLGSTGGVSWYPQTVRASSSSALVVGDSYCGAGSSTFLRNVLVSPLRALLQAALETLPAAEQQRHIRRRTRPRRSGKVL